MSNGELVSVPLEQLFDYKRGNSKYTKKYCNENMGEYEVYTGTTIGSFGKINTFDYSVPNLTYTTDGEYAGTIKLINDDKYNVGGHRAILIKKSNLLNLDYFEYILKPILKNEVKRGSVPSISWNKIKKIKVPVPMDRDNYDFEEQKLIAEKFKILEKNRKKLLLYREKLMDTYITIDLKKYNYKNVNLSDIFDFKRGISCTKTYCNKHKGVYPVYSANNINPLSYIDSYEYSGKYITVSRNGIAGKITIFDEKFTINEDRFIFIPKIEEIDYDFIKYTVEPILRRHIKGRIGHNGQNEFSKLSFEILKKIRIDIPVIEDKKFDLEAQREIAIKYKKIDEIKQGIYNKLSKLIETEVILEN